MANFYGNSKSLIETFNEIMCVYNLNITTGPLLLIWMKNRHLTCSHRLGCAWCRWVVSRSAADSRCCRWTRCLSKRCPRACIPPEWLENGTKMMASQSTSPSFKWFSFLPQNLRKLIPCQPPQIIFKMEFPPLPHLGSWSNKFEKIKEIIVANLEDGIGILLVLLLDWQKESNSISRHFHSMLLEVLLREKQEICCHFEWRNRDLTLIPTGQT